MKIDLCSAVATWIGLGLTAFVFGAENVAIGDSASQVIAALGKPNGQLQAGSAQTLIYDRGQVKLRDGHVVAIDLVSAEAAQAKEQKRAQDAERLRAAADAARAQAHADGVALKAKTLADPHFAALSPGRQLAFWQDFLRRYPDVPADAEYTYALDRYNREQAAAHVEAAKEARIADLESRVQAAEQRAANAESTAYNSGPIYHPYHSYYSDNYGPGAYTRSNGQQNKTTVTYYPHPIMPGAEYQHPDPLTTLRR